MLEVAELDKLWEDAKEFCLIMAIMIMVGQLQVETLDMALGYLRIVVRKR